MTPEQLQAAMQMVFPQRARTWAEPLNRAMFEFGIVGPLREAMFLAQVAHETRHLSALREDLMYSTPVLQQVFGRYFARSELVSFSYHPMAIANRVYANRFGNGSELSGDGYRYRGGGCLMTTFRDNYRTVGEAIGEPLEDNPDLIEQPDIAARAGAYEWFRRGCNALADEGRFLAIVRAINGGENGLAHRRADLRVVSKVYGLDQQEVERMIA